MDNRTLDLEINDMREGLAVQIANQWNEWNNARRPWLAEKEELRNYIFATDTRKTSNAALPWKNSTTIPKLCQIRDNLHANYMAALFPNDNWLSWEAGNPDSEMATKKKPIIAYMRAKTRTSQFRQVVSQLVYDYIDFGQPFADTDYVREIVINEEGEEIQSYVGPRLRRIAPQDIVFNPTAASFESSPKIVRTLVSFGTLQKLGETITDPAKRDMYQQAIAKAKGLRNKAGGLSVADSARIKAFNVDGFGMSP